MSSLPESGDISASDSATISTTNTYHNSLHQHQHQQHQPPTSLIKQGARKYHTEEPRFHSASVSNMTTTRIEDTDEDSAASSPGAAKIYDDLQIESSFAPHFPKDHVTANSTNTSPKPLSPVALFRLVYQNPHLFYSTLIYGQSFIILGCIISILGPLLPQLKMFLGVHSDAEMGLLFTIRGLGFVLGSVFAGQLVNRVAEVKWFLSGVLLMASACLILVPITPFYSLSCLIQFLLGGCGACIDLIGNTIIMKVWGTNGNPFLQLLHGMFGIGALACPAIVALILKLVPQVGYSLKLSYFIFALVTLTGIPGLLLTKTVRTQKQEREEQLKRRQKLHKRGGGKKVMSPLEMARREKRLSHQPLSAGSTLTQEEDMFALGSPTTVGSGFTFDDETEEGFDLDDEGHLPAAAAPLNHPSDSTTADSAPAQNSLPPQVDTQFHSSNRYTNLENAQKTTKRTPKDRHVLSSLRTRLTHRLHSFVVNELFTARFLVYACMSIFLGAYVGAEVAYGSIIPTFVTQKQLGSPSQAALSSSLFWCGLTVGRLAAVPLSLFLTPAWMLSLDMAGCIASIVVLFFFQSSLNAIWICSVIFGLSMSSVYPTGVAFPQISLGFELTGSATSVLVIGASMGEMLVPMVIEALFEVIGPVSMILMTGISLVVAAAVLIVLMIVFKPKQWVRRLMKVLRR